MAPGVNVTEVGAAVERVLKRIEQDLPIGVELGRISDPKSSPDVLKSYVSNGAAGPEKISFRFD
jgi:multidrug efflux pump subunit AcrB